MGGSETVYSCEIMQQTRFQFVVVGLVMAATLIAGIVLGWIAVKLGAPPRAQGGIGAASFLVCIGLAVYYFVGSQGRVTLDDEALVVAPRWRPEIRILRPPVEVGLRQWVEVTHGISMVAGPMLAVEGREETLLLAAMDPAVGERIPGKQGLQWVKTPSFRIAPADLRRLAEGLGVAWPAR